MVNWGIAFFQAGSDLRTGTISAIGLNSHVKRPSTDSLFAFRKIVKRYYFLNFFLNPAKPAKPVPKSSIVAGSGTGATETSSWFVIFVGKGDNKV